MVRLGLLLRTDNQLRMEYFALFYLLRVTSIILHLSKFVFRLTDILL